MPAKLQARRLQHIAGRCFNCNSKDLRPTNIQCQACINKKTPIMVCNKGLTLAEAKKCLSREGKHSDEDHQKVVKEAFSCKNGHHYARAKNFPSEGGLTCNPCITRSQQDKENHKRKNSQSSSPQRKILLRNLQKSIQQQPKQLQKKKQNKQQRRQSAESKIVRHYKKEIAKLVKELEQKQQQQQQQQERGEKDSIEEACRRSVEAEKKLENRPPLKTRFISDYDHVDDMARDKDLAMEMQREGIVVLHRDPSKVTSQEITGWQLSMGRLRHSTIVPSKMDGVSMPTPQKTFQMRGKDNGGGKTFLKIYVTNKGEKGDGKQVNELGKTLAELVRLTEEMTKKVCAEVGSEEIPKLEEDYFNAALSISGLYLREVDIGFSNDAESASSPLFLPNWNRNGMLQVILETQAKDEVERRKSKLKGKKLQDAIAKATLNDGVQTPWFYLYSALSGFACHVEDCMLPSANVVGEGSAPVIWYVIPERHVEALVKKLHEELHDEEWRGDLLEFRRMVADPRQLISWGIPVRRVIQYPGEVVLLGAAAVHWGVNCGSGAKAAWNYSYLGENIELWRRTCASMNRIYNKFGILEGQQRHGYSIVSWVAKQETADKIRRKNAEIEAERTRLLPVEERPRKRAK